MQELNIEYAEDEKAIYDEIKRRLSKAISSLPEEKKSFLSPMNLDVPGPGHYSILETLSPLSAKKSIKFTTAKRFLDENHASERQITTGDVSANQMIGTGNSVTLSHSNSLRTLGTTENQSKIQYYIARSQNKSQFSSFSRSKRVFELKLGEINDVGPGTYDVNLLSPKRISGFSFGSKWNDLTPGVISPGPTAYRPEFTEIRANHQSVRGPVMTKPERKSSDQKGTPTKPPKIENYFKIKNIFSSSPKQSELKKPIMGSGPKIAVLPKEKINVPGPGAYEISGSYTDRARYVPKNISSFPSFGKPSDHNSQKWFREELPGPGEYNPRMIESNKGKIKIGTSKRPDVSDPKKQVEVVLNEEKMKRLRRSENLEKAQADREKLKVNKHIKPVKSTKLYFDELVKQSDAGPGFSYDLDKYNKISSNISGGEIGTSERKFMKEVEDAKNTPDLGNYDIVKENGVKPVPEVKFSVTGRQDNFVKKDSHNIPGVGTYGLKDLSSNRKGGNLAHAKKGVVDEKVQKHDKIHVFYHFIEGLDKKLEEITTKEKNRIQNSPW